MEASPPTSPSSLRHRLRTTVCCCFGSPGERRSGEKLRWRRRVAAGEFGYDPLSYALNFDDGDGDDDAADDAAAAFRYKNFSSRLPPSPVAAPARRSTAIAIS
ncbi:uncharacterized protein [Oryza sativa Japonica Group]|jgi:hypothetical protein|uniref:Os06g0646100 protein n=5 Tax=Oryza TaxID=4527 RepID=A0A0P0WZC1_ORYSJ|nr:uncharacterized protein LOC4341658 [Oryza sativa Japonica Group]EAZ01872.1 hypothetical protein OsI_23893 [Oryza sativa Indica Group]KAB8103303.1 hypothetical protein EE612_035658 [Oryza sativa]EAZ37813.1 hypothetical protein OsJ_22150 [Oryza sativa Japonica Group]KAF2927806.1 hypothetical protein DAI22_06g232200 [Oryza sativa Japonica Group]BAD37453.1 unknown protein [Oryza sativa Japonica Group]|eukprot:NP_001058197.1 Os06g0646100 [Oryza sativa Japonica Group]